MESKCILAFVGMPGAGKSEAASYLQKEKNIPFVRFGQITDDGLKTQGLAINAENERAFRESLRSALGMAAYAIKSKDMIDALLKDHVVIGIDGLYSWEEYVFLKRQYPFLRLIHVYAEPEIRYTRLEKRKIRAFSHDQAAERDIAEIEKLNKGGPIAIANYLIVNNDDDLSHLHRQIDVIGERIGI